MAEFEYVLAAALEGDDDALISLYRDVYPRFVRYAGAVTPGAAEDVAADAWLDVAQSFAGPPGADPQPAAHRGTR